MSQVPAPPEGPRARRSRVSMSFSRPRDGSVTFCVHGTVGPGVFGRGEEGPCVWVWKTVLVLGEGFLSVGPSLSCVTE
jgi:hypothetical protein